MGFPYNENNETLDSRIKLTTWNHRILSCIAPIITKLVRFSELFGEFFFCKKKKHLLKK